MLWSHQTRCSANQRPQEHKQKSCSRLNDENLHETDFLFWNSFQKSMWLTMKHPCYGFWHFEEVVQILLWIIVLPPLLRQFVWPLAYGMGKKWGQEKEMHHKQNEKEKTANILEVPFLSLLNDIFSLWNKVRLKRMKGNKGNIKVIGLNMLHFIQDRVYQ